MEEFDLIGKDSKGKLRVVAVAGGWSDEQHGYVIQRTTGCYNGKLTSQPPLLIDKGKAKRTVTEQYRLKMNSLLKEYKDKGYKQLDNSIDTYTEDELLEIVGANATNQAGVLKPMLAKQEDKVSNRKIFDKKWYASRKIDGVRCMFYWDGSEVKSASRGGGDYNPATSHLREHPLMIELFKANPELILDGELYLHGKSLQQISGAARLEKNAYDCDWLEYYLYDIVDTTKPFEERLATLHTIRDRFNLPLTPEYVFEKNELQMRFVPHVEVSGWENMLELHNQYVSEGWEGLVIRDPSKPYKPNGRTNDMIKIKKYLDAEFEITGLSEGLRDEDMCFTLITEDGKPFKAKPMGSRELKQQYREDLDDLIGKMATVKFFYLSDDGTPLQPVLKTIRDYE